MILVPATVHGRVLIEPDEGAAVSLRVLVGFHGYAQTAGDMMQELQPHPRRERLDASLHPGAESLLHSRRLAGGGELDDARGSRPGHRRQHRVRGCSDCAGCTSGHGMHASARVFVGFSQGAAMAYRAALSGARPAAGIIALAGDIPPELKTDAATRHPWPKVLIGVGTKEQWYSGAKLDEDLAFLSKRGIDHSVVRFEGGHEWTEEFRNAAGTFLAECRAWL